MAYISKRNRRKGKMMVRTSGPRTTRTIPFQGSRELVAVSFSYKKAQEAQDYLVFLVPLWLLLLSECKRVFQTDCNSVTALTAFCDL
jgi:hypothetical protein